MFSCHLTAFDLRLRRSQHSQHAEKVAAHHKQTGKPTHKGLQEQTAGTWIEVCKDRQIEHFRRSR
jgi:hypothetical protein